jgi:hypothetical protein
VGAGRQVRISKAIANSTRCLRQTPRHVPLAKSSATAAADNRARRSRARDQALCRASHPFRPVSPPRRVIPTGAAGGARLVAVLQMGVMGAFQESVIIEVAADQVSRYRQWLEILGGERCCPIGEREQLVGFTPCPAPVALASPLEFRLEHVSDYSLPAVMSTGSEE